MPARGLNLAGLLRPYWKLLTIAFGAMLVQAAADLLEPWPLKVIFDYVLGAKPMPAWIPLPVRPMTSLCLTSLQARQHRSQRMQAL